MKDEFYFILHPFKKLPRNAVCRHVFEPAFAGGCRFPPSHRYRYPAGKAGKGIEGEVPAEKLDSLSKRCRLKTLSDITNAAGRIVKPNY